MDPLEVVPLDLISHILLFLSVQKVEGCISQLNKKWNAIIKNPNVCKFRRKVCLPATQYTFDDELGFIPTPFINNEIITDDIIMKISSKYPSLRDITINSTIVTDIGLITVANKCKYLEKLQ
jgi:hypothetical protein